MTTLSKTAPILAFLFVLISLLPNPSLGQSNSIFDVMHHQEVLEITIKADLDSLKNSRRSDDYQKAHLTFKNENGQLQSWKMKLKTRGKFRRKMSAMPPLKMKFKKAELADAGLNEFNDMKLVTHAVKNKAEAKKLLMKEYLAYKIYEELTENSYRTQLVRITYKDQKTGIKSKNWGFLIEDTAQLADRMQAEKCDCWASLPSDFQYRAAAQMSLFQFMIGNEDFSIKNLKNVKVFRKDGQLIPVPYDFDFSGLVNAPYATPNQNYQLKAVTDRVYLGNPQSLQELHSSRMLFYAKKQAILEIVTNFKKLDVDSKLEMRDYLKSFFDYMDTLKMPQNILPVGPEKTLLQSQILENWTKE
ncbi:MAG: hypothetical protein ACI9XO_000928 [Paraglaciecola sp.]|jgi:hypothetical protein